MIQNISKYRRELMGLATLWVVLYHNREYQPELLRYVAATGYGGVDIFLFLSGFGLTVGYGKHSLLGFYLRRFLRVFPVLFLLCLVWIWLEHRPFTDALTASLGIGYYVRRLAFWDWYVPTIYLFYLLFPLWMWVNRRTQQQPLFRPLVLSTLVVSALGIGWSLYVIMQHRAGMNMLAITRIPIFFVGSGFGFLYHHQRELPSWASRLLMALSVVVTVAHVYAVLHLSNAILWGQGLYWFPLIVSIPGLILLLASLLAHTPQVVRRGLAFLGGISLEFYLIHCLYLDWTEQHLASLLSEHPWLELLALLLICSAAAWAFQWVVMFFVRKIKLPK